MESLGCPKNTSDSELMIEKLRKDGYIYVPSHIDADTIIVNTCAFIKPAIKESLKVIDDYLKMKKDVIVTGCLLQRDIKLPIKEGKHLKMIRLNEILGFEGRAFTGENVSKNYIEPEHYRYIKIADGCSHRCSFCTIPQIKGRYRSKPVEIIMKEIESLDDSVKEIILVSQDTTRYGIDIYGENSLYKLLKKIKKVFKGWIRMLYLHPLYLTDDVIKIMSEEENFTKYLDIPFQHISDDVLKSFRRGYYEKDVMRLIEKIRKNGNIFIRGTFIIGSPFEKERDFEKLCKFVKDASIERLCYFIYSPEEGTELYKSGYLDKKILLEREKEFYRISSEIRERVNEDLLWKHLKILVDGKEDLYYGRTEYDAPEIDNIVYINQKANIGEFEDVEIVSFTDTFLFADKLQEDNKKRGNKNNRVPRDQKRRDKNYERRT